MNWFGINFTGRGSQRQQRAESLERVKAVSMSRLDKAAAEQSEAAESVKEAVVEQTHQSRALRAVVKGVINLLQRREDRLKLRRDHA